MKSILLTLWNVLFSFLIYLLSFIFFSLAMVPALRFFLPLASVTFQNPHLGIVKFFLIAFYFAIAYFIYGFSLMLLIGFFRIIFQIRLKEGEYPIHSAQAFTWAFISSLYVIIHHTFVDYIIVTPFSNLMFRLLGAKVGQNVHFISKNIFDATLLAIGDNTIIGGSAVIIAHSVEHGKLILKKVTIGKNVTIGSHSMIMPGCQIGDGATIGSHAVVLKDTIVGPKETWFGIPAEKK